MKTLLSATALAVAMGIACPAQTQAQTTPNPSPSGQDGTDPQAQNVPPKPVPPSAPEPDTGDGRVIKWDFNYIGEAAANPVGGIRQDAAFSGQVYLGADVDLDRAFGIPGATLHGAVTNRDGKSLSAIAIGNGTSVQEINGLQNSHLARLSYEQHLFNDRLEIEVGRMVGAVNTLASPLYCNFQSNAVCGNPVVIYKNSNINGFPVSAWGARTKLFLTERVNILAGAYEVNPRQNQLSQDGFNFSFKGSKGVYLPVELSYSTTFKNDTMPRNYSVGIWFDRSPYNDPVLDSAGGAAVVSGLPYARRYGRSSAWIRFDQMIVRPDPTSERGLSLFGIALAGVDGRNTLSNYFTLGLLQSGTFRGRDRDTIGFAVTDQVFSKAAIRNISAARASVGASTDIPRHEFMMELNYGAQLGPVRVMPNLQYIINPDQQSSPFRTRDIPDAFVLGLKVAIDFIGVANALDIRR
jgi:porin